MEYSIANDRLHLTVSSQGAELWVLHRVGEEDRPLLWNGEPSVWPRRAPVCFPWCGKPEDGWYEYDGKRYEAPQHGFIRDMEHTLTDRGEDFLEFTFSWPGDDKLCPWPFTFKTRHTLSGDQVITTCTAVNEGEDPMPAQLGFHTGLRCPFTAGLTPQDYVLRFELPEAPGGGDTFALEPHVFDNDSIPLRGLKSKWIQVEEKTTGHFLRMGTEGFPYVLLWSKPGIPGYVCIEPWTGHVGPGHDLAQRPGAVLLGGGESLSRTQVITVAL